MPVTVQTPFNEYSPNGATTVFPFTFYCAQSQDLNVFIDGVEQLSGFSIAGLGVGAGGTVTFDVAPASGTFLRIDRRTIQDRQTDYTEGGDLAAETLDDDFDRIVVMIQDLQLQSFDVDGFGNWDAGGNRIVNVGDPVDDQDAATKIWVLTEVDGPVQEAAASAAAAAASASAAASSASSAASSLSQFNDSFTVGASPPGSPTVGDLWYNTTLGLMYVYNGTAFEQLASQVFNVQLGQPFGQNGTETILEKSDIRFTLNSAAHKTASGTIAYQILLNTSPVIGLTNTIDSSQTTDLATSGNLVNIGDRLEIVFSSNSAAQRVSLTLKGTRES